MVTGTVGDAFIAIGIGVFLLIVVLPVAALFVFSLLDILWRKDIGWRKLLWAVVVLAVPLMGLLVYWLLRPKDFDPWEESERPVYTPVTAREPSFLEPPATAREPLTSATRMMTPALQGGSDPEPMDNDAPPT